MIRMEFVFLAQFMLVANLLHDVTVLPECVDLKPSI